MENTLALFDGVKATSRVNWLYTPDVHGAIIVHMLTCFSESIVVAVILPVVFKHIVTALNIHTLRIFLY